MEKALPRRSLVRGSRERRQRLVGRREYGSGGPDTENEKRRNVWRSRGLLHLVEGVEEARGRRDRHAAARRDGPGVRVEAPGGPGTLVDVLVDTGDHLLTELVEPRALVDLDLVRLEPEAHELHTRFGVQPAEVPVGVLGVEDAERHEPVAAEIGLSTAQLPQDVAGLTRHEVGRRRLGRDLQERTRGVERLAVAVERPTRGVGEYHVQPLTELGVRRLKVDEGLEDDAAAVARERLGGRRGLEDPELGPGSPVVTRVDRAPDEGLAALLVGDDEQAGAVHAVELATLVEQVNDVAVGLAIAHGARGRLLEEGLDPLELRIVGIESEGSQFQLHRITMARDVWRLTGRGTVSLIITYDNESCSKMTERWSTE